MLFDPYVVRMANGHTSLVTPPVVEVTKDGKNVLMEGVTRCFILMMEQGVETIRAVVVRNGSVQMPGRVTRPLRHLRTTSLTTALSQNIEGFDHSLFRRIEEEVHPYPLPEAISKRMADLF